MSEAKLYHIGIGRTHAGTRTLLLIQDLHIRIINAATGELLRELTLDPARSDQPTANHAEAAERATHPTHQCGSAVIPMS